MPRHLFLDEGDIELQQGVARRWHQPVKTGAPVLAPEGAAEDRFIRLLGTPLREESGEWRMWYSGAMGRHVFLARSEDGLRWSRPDLQLVQPAKTRPNNELDLGPDADGTVREIVRHPRVIVPEHAYVGCLWKSRRIRPMFSGDGLRWRMAPGHRGIPSGDESSLSVDGDSGRLLLTVKLGGPIGLVRNAVPEFGRAVALMTSATGIKWTDPVIIFHADHRDREAGIRLLERHRSDPTLLDPGPINLGQAWTDVYKMPVFRYADRFIGLPTLFHQTGARAYEHNPAKGNQGGLLQPCLAWSRDLRRWERVPDRAPFIPLSPVTDPAAYDCGMIFPAPPVCRDGELWFYYVGRRDGHMDLPGRTVAREQGLPVSAVFLARLRRDGFASLHAGAEGGAVLTPPVKVAGASLFVNVAAAGGEVRVEIRDAESGRPVPGFGMGDALASRTVALPDGTTIPRRGGGFGMRFGDDTDDRDETIPVREDAVDARVAWRKGSDLTPLHGRNVRLLFALRNADLYAFEFR